MLPWVEKILAERDTSSLQPSLTDRPKIPVLFLKNHLVRKYLPGQLSITDTSGFQVPSSHFSALQMTRKLSPKPTTLSMALALLFGQVTLTEQIKLRSRLRLELYGSTPILKWIHRSHLVVISNPVSGMSRGWQVSSRTATPRLCIFARATFKGSVLQ